MNKTVLLIHPHAENLVDGVATHCQRLYELFHNDNEIVIPKPENYPYRKIALFNNLFHFLPLLRAIRNSRADIIHIHGYTTLQVGQALLAAAIYRKKIVYTPHWHPFHELRRPLLAKAFFNLTIAPLIRMFASSCIGLNHEDSEFLKKLGKPVYTIPHWIEAKGASLSEKVSKKGRMILFVGRFDALNKGIDYLWHLPEGMYDIHLVGKGDINPRCDMTLHINIPNEELSKMYLESALVVVPSQYEAFSLVSLEALTAGTPVVMSDKVRIADYLNGIEGVRIFKYGDYDDFCRAVKESMYMKVDKESIYDIFSPETARTRYRQVYMDTLSRNNNK